MIIEEKVFKKLHMEKNGMDVNGEYVTDLKFGDDIALIQHQSMTWRFN